MCQCPSSPAALILHRADSWLVYYGDVHVDTIARVVGNPGAEPQWKWLCGFYPGSNLPGLGS